MEFRTPITVPSADFKLDLQSRIVTVGSCFAEAMGARMHTNKIPVLINPFGTIFNPVSLAKVLALSLKLETLNESRMVQVNDQWYHYDFHSRLAATTSQTLLSTIQKVIQQTSNFLISTDCLILTLGTTVAYRLQNDGQVVANCHKVPTVFFRKELLSLPEVLPPLEILLAELSRRNPALKIILTVSPVRHTKDTLETNSVSKALLRVACHQLATRFDFVHYFPAYEIMLDDLRDYRFYKADMVHPSEVAEEYIWQLFIQTYLTDSAQKFTKSWNKIRQALAHRPFQERSTAYGQFLQKLEKQLLSLPSVIDVSAELADVRNRINQYNTQI